MKVFATLALIVLPSLLACDRAPAPHVPHTLEFREVLEEGEGKQYAYEQETLELGTVRRFALEDAGSSRDSVGNFAIEIRFTRAARSQVETWARSLMGKRVAVLIDDEVVSAPRATLPLPDTYLLTSHGRWSEEEAREIARGLLPE